MPTADALARQARERALREGNAGHPAAAVRHAWAGLYAAATRSVTQGSMIVFA